jgi:hypothetical protein
LKENATEKSETWKTKQKNYKKSSVTDAVALNLSEK